MVLEGVSILKRLSWIANILFHQAIAVIVVYVATTAFTHFNIDAPLTWHIVLNTIGIMLLASEALILWCGPNVYTLFINRSKKWMIHSGLMWGSTILISIGIGLQISDRSEHFDSTHSIIGLVAWILIWISIILGIMSTKALSLEKLGSPIVFKLIHTAVGLCAFAFGLAALGLGMGKDGFKLISQKDTVTAAIVVMALLGLWASATALRSIYRLTKSLISSR